LRIAFAVPGDLAALTGGYGYARRVIAAWRADGIAVDAIPLPGSFPNPSAHDLDAACTSLAAVPVDTPLLVDGLAYGALPAVRVRALNRPVLALVHHPLADETGLSDVQRRTAHEQERAALAAAAHVCVSSPSTGRQLTGDYGVDVARVTVAEPGTDPAPRAMGAAVGADPVLLTVGTLTRRKGHDVLVQALDRIRDLPWHSEWIGSTDRDPAWARHVQDLIREADLGVRVGLRGSVDDDALAYAYGRADVFVLATHFEGYGMVFTEALARGLPIVASGKGAVPDTVPRQAGAVVPPGDPAALAGALRHMLTHPDRRAECAAAAWQAGQALPRWRDTAAILRDALWRFGRTG